MEMELEANGIGLPTFELELMNGIEFENGTAFRSSDAKLVSDF